jgi:cycloeucalenol cycloisomerase
MIDSSDIVVTMTAVLSTMIALLGGLIYVQTPAKSGTSSFYPNPKTEPSKYAYEMYHTIYSPIWISIFGIIVVFQLYESWSAREYNLYLLLLSLPCILQPIIFPSAFFSSPDAQRPLSQRYATKANIWFAIYAFIGNYWYTHYFYSVLKASYSMPSTRLNNVPIAMYFATMFYFSSYHVFSNTLLRKIKTTFEDSPRKRVLYVSTVFVLSYFTAFMETLTISSFPYYQFEDRDLAYKVGSAFYGIYFLVSFPAFLEFDKDVDEKGEGRRKVTCWNAVVESCGYGMMIMCLLDFVRLYLGIPLTIGV